MMERPDHINPWADKLQDVRIPDMQDAWRAMELRLDEDMPRKRGRDWRRWMLLIILLLLLIGVCNCPGLRHRYTEKDVRKDSVRKDIGKEGDGVDPVVAKGKVEVVGEGDEVQERLVTGEAVEKKGDSGEGRFGRGSEGADKGAVGGSGIGPAGRSGGVVGGEEVRDEGGRVDGSGKMKAGGGSSKREKIGGGANGSGRGSGQRVQGGAYSTGRRTKRGTGRIYERTLRDTVAGGDTDSVVVSSLDTSKGRDLARGRDSAATPKKILNKPAPAKQHTDSVAAANKKKDSLSSRTKGWMVGIGLNQFFTVGQQASSDFNSSGTTGRISDYIPVPMVRYYFSDKLFVQLEAQINTPQYTKKDLLAQQSNVDSLTVPNTRRQSTVTIKKLFYFNVPLSIHYSPVPNLSVGAGVQYSRLTNGVGLYEDKGLARRPGATDTLITSKVQSFKQDTLYQKMKTQELRMLLDISYKYKNFILGARYNRALRNYLDVKVSNTQITQARNSQLQIYIRYILWDGRKKTLLTK